MASIIERKGKYCVVYRYEDEHGKKRQHWETFETKSEAAARKKEIENGFITQPLEVAHIVTVADLMREYINVYGVNNWALSTYEGICSAVDNYVIPILGDMKVAEITTRVMDQYYQSLLKVKSASRQMKCTAPEYLTPSRVREIHKILRSAFNQAIRWGVVEKNPTVHATLPKVKKKEREIWTAEQLFQAVELCKDARMKLALNLAFSCSLRLGEMLGLTWDCVDIAPDKISSGTASVYIEKELQRVKKEALDKLENKDVMAVFPNISPKNTTCLILKTPKTASSVRRVFLPPTVASMLIERKKEIEEMKKMFGDEYTDYNLVFTHDNGRPLEGGRIQTWMNEIIREGNLPRVVFHSIRHSSITYKLKLNGGDIKAVQGDSGHSQVKMVTDVYSHIIDEDRKKNAQKFEEAFYGGASAKTQDANGDVAELLQKVASDPKMLELLKTLAGTMK